MAVQARFEVIGFNRSGPAIAGFARNVRRMATEVTTSGRGVERATGRIHGGMMRLMKFMGQQLTGTIRSFFYGLRMGVVGAGVAVSAFVVSSLKSFRDFDKKLRETTALIAGAGTGGSAKNLSAAIKEADKNYANFYKNMLRMAPQMRRTPQELAGGLYELVQAGLKGPQAMRLLKPAALGATAGGGTVESSARVLVQIMNALRMGTTGSKAGATGTKVMDKIFQAINLGVGVDFSTLSTGIGKFIGSAGVTFKGGRGKGGMRTLDELLATYIFATQQGARTSDVGVGIQDVIKTIANPSVKGGKFAKGIGLDLGSQYLRKQGFVGALKDIIAHMERAGYTGARLNDAIGKLFGDVRGRRIVAYAANLKMVDTAMDSMTQSGGALSRSFQEQGKSLDAAMQTFKAYWETVKIALGNAAAPVLRRSMLRLTDILGQAGALGAGQDIMAEAPEHGRARARYFRGLSDEQKVAVQQAQKFNRSNFGGRIKMIGQAALTNFKAWWNSPQTQTAFQQALHSLIQRSFDALGRAIHTIPSIYKFGVKMGGEILRGVVDGLKSSIKGMLGGGGGGMKSPLGGISGDPFQAMTQLMLGGGVAFAGRKGSPLGRAKSFGLGGLLAGLDPMTSLLLSVIGGGTGWMKNKKAGVGGLDAVTDKLSKIAEMRVNAGTVIINTGRVTGGGGGVGVPVGGKTPGRMIPPIAGGAGPQIFAGPGTFPKEGYTYASSLKNQRTYLKKYGLGGFASPAEAFPTYGPMTEAQWKAQASRMERMRYGMKMGYRGIGGGGGAASLGLGLAGTLPGLTAGGGVDWKQALGGGLQAAGGALTFVAPEVGLPLLAAGTGLTMWDSLFGGGGKKPTTPKTVNPFDLLTTPTAPLHAPKGTVKTILDKNTFNPYAARFKNMPGAKANQIITGGDTTPSGLGGRFGLGGGFDVKRAAARNTDLAGISGKYFHSAKIYYSALNKLMATQFGDDDAAAKWYERAYTYGQTSDQAIALLDSVAQEWHNRSLEEAAGRAETSKANKALRKTFKTRKLTPATAQKMLDRGLFRQVADMTKLSPEQKKKFEDQGSVPLNRFGFGWDRESRVLRNSAPQKVQELFKSYQNAITAASSGTGATGPSTAPPPAGGSSGRFNNAQNVDFRGATGSGNALGDAMEGAGGQMADRVSENIANSLVKKAMQGPTGKAQKGLNWLYQQVGKPYIWGGGHPPGLNLKGYDCSGLASSALMAMGSSLAGTTTTMLPQTAPGHGIVTLGFNNPKNPSHMGIGVLGQWFEARGHATPILGPGKARTQWPYYGTPKFHKGGVYDSGMTRGEGPAILKDGELVVRQGKDGGLQAHPVAAGGGYFINGPLIGHAEIRSAHDVHRVAQELANLLEKRRQNSTKVGAD